MLSNEKVRVIVNAHATEGQIVATPDMIYGQVQTQPYSNLGSHSQKPEIPVTPTPDCLWESNRTAQSDTRKRTQNFHWTKQLIKSIKLDLEVEIKTKRFNFQPLGSFNTVECKTPCWQPITNERHQSFPTLLNWQRHIFLHIRIQINQNAV